MKTTACTLWRLAQAALLCVGLFGCATSLQPTALPTLGGTIASGVLERKLEVIGLVSLEMSTGNVAQTRRDGARLLTANVNVPVGTVVITPAVNGWILGYGKQTARSANTFDWDAEDNNWGIGLGWVNVTKINPVNTLTTPPTQTATVSVSMLLGEDTLNDPWFGRLAFTLICFGLPGAGLSTPFEPPPVRLVPVPD